MTPITMREANQYSPLTLAFLGDAVYEQLVRERLVREANRPAGVLHRMSVKRVRAAYQSHAYGVLEPLLSEEEQAVLKRGRNAEGNTVPKSSNPAEYHRATAVECLFGWLHLQGRQERIYTLFEEVWRIREILDQNQSEAGEKE